MEATRLVRELDKNIPFSLDEFCIEGVDSCPQHIQERIWKYHILPILPVREAIGLPLTASKKSCYRSKEWEISKGRSGESQHTFENGLGACDWTFAKGVNRTIENLDKLKALLIKHTLYTRIAVYPTFIHCDYKETSGKRYIFKATSSGWSHIGTSRLWG